MQSNHPSPIKKTVRIIGILIVPATGFLITWAMLQRLPSASANTLPASSEWETARSQFKGGIPVPISISPPPKAADKNEKSGKPAINEPAEQPVTARDKTPENQIHSNDLAFETIGYWGVGGNYTLPSTGSGILYGFSKTYANVVELSRIILIGQPGCPESGEIGTITRYDGSEKIDDPTSGVSISVKDFFEHYVKSQYVWSEVEGNYYLYMEPTQKCSGAARQDQLDGIKMAKEMMRNLEPEESVIK